MNATHHADRLLSVARLARRLGVTARWLREQTRAGRIPALHCGGSRYLYDYAAVERALLNLASAREGRADA